MRIVHGLSGSWLDTLVADRCPASRRAPDRPPKVHPPELHRRLPGAVADDPDALATHGALPAQARRLADQLVQD
jgi:hypothetical protein